MNKREIFIPPGIEYISQWKDYFIPRGEHCIVDKGVTGCGYTELALTNDDWVVLCSPRRLLLENKSDKHLREGHKNVLYLDNISADDMIDRIRVHLEVCKEYERPPKLLITYDSTKKIVDSLIELGLLDKFIFVVDEFQSIFLDSYFKVGVEFDFINSVQPCKNVVYLSATPLLDKYLIQIPEFRELTFYKLDWSESGFVDTIRIGRKKTNSLVSECIKIVNNFQKGDFPITTKGKEVFLSKEAVFYFNSVSEILRVVRKCGLTPKNTLIVCSKTDKNFEKLKKEGFTFSKIPLEDEPNPMFTFCTSAVYMGVDLYSDCASSYVFADPNVDCLALDISLDLPQIIGRQRNKNNPFKNNIVLFYKTKRSDELELTEENFKSYLEKKRKSTNILLNGFEKLDSVERSEYVKKLKESIEYSNYSNDFVSISEKTGKPIYNTLIDIADQRAWDVSQKDYQDTLSVTKTIQNLETFNVEVEDFFTRDEKILQDFLDSKFYSRRFFTDRLKVYCEFRDKYKDNPVIMEGLIHKVVDQRYNQYYNYFGTEGCRANQYQESYLLRNLKDDSKSDLITEEIYSRFSTNDRLLPKDVKSILKEIYSKLSLSKTPKATDLENYFEITKTTIRVDGEVKRGMKLGKRLINHSKEDNLVKTVYSVFEENEEITQMALLTKLRRIYSDLGIEKEASVNDIEEYFMVEKKEVELYGHEAVSGFKLGRRLK